MQLRRRGRVRVYRDIRQAEDAQLAGLRNTAAELLDSYERFLGGDMVESLCLLREAVAREQQRRLAAGNSRSAQEYLRCGPVPTAAAQDGLRATG